MDFRELNRISLKYGNFELKQFYEDHKRDFTICSFDNKSKLIKVLDGFQSSKLISLCTSNLQFEHYSIFAGYRLIEDEANNPKPIDAYIFNTSLFDFKNGKKLYELLTFHEIVHFLEKTGFFEILKIRFTQNDLKIGNKLNTIAQDISDKSGGFGDPDHNEIFGALLNYFFRKYNPQKRHLLLGKAMIKNFLEDYSESFK